MRIGFMVFPYQVELPLAEASMGGTASGSAPEASCPLSVFGDHKQMMARFYRKIAPI
ncbi:hypothetical protein IJS18_02295 [Candidatus Saccharibacteria bacterium]|nr:hypothetical protein [Candidatus Saccharibacteria bacterium]